MDIKKLQKIVIDALENVKAQDLQVYDTSHMTSMFDRIVVASGTSNRQTKALASSVRDKVKEAGGKIISIEGDGTGEWVLVDLGDMIVHIMQPTIRAYYRLEELWGEKPVKIAAVKRVTKIATKTTKKPATVKKKAPGTLASDTPKKRVGVKAVAVNNTPMKPVAKKPPATKKSTAAKTTAHTDKTKISRPKKSKAEV